MIVYNERCVWADVKKSILCIFYFSHCVHYYSVDSLFLTSGIFIALLRGYFFSAVFIFVQYLNARYKLLLHCMYIVCRDVKFDVTEDSHEILSVKTLPRLSLVLLLVRILFSSLLNSYMHICRYIFDYYDNMIYVFECNYSRGHKTSNILDVHLINDTKVRTYNT